MVSRLSVLVLVGACAMQLLTGLINIAEWYPWAFFFTDDALLDRLARDRRGRGARRREGAGDPPRSGPPGTAGRHGRADSEAQAAERAAVDDAAETRPVPRRAFVVAAGLGVGAVTLTTVGQSFSPLGAVSVLSPRIPGVGPQGCRCGRPRGAPRSPTSGRTYRLVIEGRTGSS